MASVTAGEVLGIKQPGNGETVRLPLMLLDDNGAAVTGEAYDAAGMDVDYKKEGDSAFSAFPTFDTNNWDEIGWGMYELILRESDATEKALLDTGGHFAVYVKTTATRGDVFLFKVNPSDSVRDDVATDALIGYLANISGGAVTAVGPTKAQMDTAHALLATPAQVLAQAGSALTTYDPPTDTEAATYIADVGALALEATLASGIEDILHSPWPTVFVQVGATGNDDGTTWTDAYPTIQAALTAADDTGTVIIVGAGTYAEAITIANNDIELNAFDFNTPFAHSSGTVRVTGAANVPTCSITGDRVEVIGIDFTDHATGERDGIYVNGADDLKITKCTIEGINSQLRDGIRILGNARECNIFGCHIYGAEGSGINITAAETHTHIWDTSIQVEDGATAALNLSGAVTNLGIYNCRLFAAGTVAQGILFGADSIGNRATNIWCHNFTTPYTDNGTTNNFINVFDMVAPADAAAYTAARGAKLENLDATVGSRSSHTAANVWAVGTRTLTSYGTLVADAAAAVWEIATSGLTTVGSIGKLLVDNINATISSRGTADTGDAMTLTADAVDDTSVEDYDKFKATGFAEAGNQMDLVDAPNATAVTAIQSGLAVEAGGNIAAIKTVTDNLATVDDMADGVTDELLAGHTTDGSLGKVLSDAAIEATLTAIKGVGWSDETLVTIKAVLDTAAADVVNIDGAAMKGTDGAALASAYTIARAAKIDNLDITVSSRSSHTAANAATAVWAATARTLTSLGTTAVASIWNALTSGLTTVGSIGKLLVDNTAGTGANVVTLTLHDADGNDVPSVGLVVRNADESARMATAKTDSNGEAVVNLDDATYVVRFGPAGGYDFDATATALVVSGTTATTFTCVAVVIPASDDPTLCTCYIDLRYADTGALIGAEEGSIQVIEVKSAGDIWPSVATTAAAAVDGSKNLTDADGRASFNAIRGMELKVRVVRPWGTDCRAKEDTKSNDIDITVPSAASYAIQLSQN